MQANNLPGQENANVNTNLGPNMGQPAESERSTPQPFLAGSEIKSKYCHIFHSSLLLLLLLLKKVGNARLGESG